MSGNSFNDFAALKALKRELERADAAASGAESAEAASDAESAGAKSSAESAGADSGAQAPGTVAGTKHYKSKPAEPRPSSKPTESKSGPKSGAHAPALQPGMRVTLMDSNDRGVVRHVRKDCVEIELECGIVVPVGMRDFIVNDAEEDRKLSRVAAPSRRVAGGAGKPAITGKSLEIDLHIEALPGGQGVAKGQELPYQLEYFRRTLRSRLKHRGSRIIFVHGVGDGILKSAIREELDSTFALSCSWNPYGEGATAVTIR